MYPVKQSTAITVPFFVHDANGDAVLALTDGSFTKRISQGSAAFGAMTVVISEMENGWYSIPLSATHSDTLGLLTILFTNAGAKQVNLQFRVSARIPDDLAFPTTTGRSIDVTAAGEVGLDLDNTVGTIDAAQIGAAAITAAKIATDAIDNTKIAAGAITSSEAPNLDAAVTSRLAPTVGGNTLDVTATGAAGVDWANVEGQATVVDLSATDFQLVDTTVVNSDMRGTENAALASVLGALADVTAAGDPTAVDTVMQYMKQLINTLEGAVGIPVFPASVAPGNNVSIAETLRQIYDEVAGLGGVAMRGTDSAALATVCTELRLAELDPANLPTDVAARATPAQVNTEVVDVMTVDTVTLPGQAAPSNTPTMEEILGWIYKTFRNKKEQDATEWRLFDNAGAVVDSKATISEAAGTATKEEIETGP